MKSLLVSLQELDQQTFLQLWTWVQGQKWVASASIFAANLGYALIILALAFLWFSGKDAAEKQQRRLGIAAAFVVALIARFGLKPIIVGIWSRARPFEALGFNPLIPQDPGAAFPSGHALFYFALATTLWLHNKKTGALFGALAILFSLGRVLVGIHWPGDILAGFLLGGIVAFILTRPLTTRLKRLFE